MHKLLAFVLCMLCMQRSRRLVRDCPSTSSEKGSSFTCREDVPGNCSSSSSDDESTSSDEDEVIYMHGIRSLRPSGTSLGSILESSDNDEDNSLDQIRNRHGEELDVLRNEMMEEMSITRAIQGLSLPFKTYIDYLRENGRFAGE